MRTTRHHAERGRRCLSRPDTAPGSTGQPQQQRIARTLFVYLGAIFILAGISTYIGMFWNRMGSVMRIVW